MFTQQDKKLNPRWMPKLAKRGLLAIAPFIATSAIATSPALGATFAFSEASALLDDFSHRPHSTHTFAGTNALTIAGLGSSVTALGQANAILANSPTQEPFAGNFSSSLALGEGHDYRGLAQSEARIVGNFFVEENQSFSFDFYGFLNMATAIDNPIGESATATGNIFLGLFDSTNLESVTLLDYLSLSGHLATAADTDFLNYENSDAIAADYSSKTAFGGTEEFASVSVNGSLQRYFSSRTHLTLIEFKATQVAVKAPEPGFTLGFIALGIGVVLKSKNKKSTEN